MPQPLRKANLAPRWWPASATNTFVLFTMKDASMSYHIDLVRVWARVRARARARARLSNPNPKPNPTLTPSPVGDGGLLRGAVGREDLRRRATHAAAGRSAQLECGVAAHLYAVTCVLQGWRFDVARGNEAGRCHRLCYTNRCNGHVRCCEAARSKVDRAGEEGLCHSHVSSDLCSKPAVCAAKLQHPIGPARA